MSRVRQRDTGPELLVRSAAHKLGLRFRLHRSDLPGHPDIAFSARKVAVFVHGCFWHRHRGCSRCTTPKSNATYWKNKFRDNRSRDARVQRRLTLLGWKSVVIWECEARDPEVLAQRLKEIGLKPSHFRSER